MDFEVFFANIFEFINYANKYFDENKPWDLAKERTEECEKILYNCCNIIFNINNLLKPYFVETTKKVEDYLNSTNSSYSYKKIGSINLTKEISPLFIRYDKDLIKIEKEKLNALKNTK